MPPNPLRDLTKDDLSDAIAEKIEEAAEAAWKESQLVRVGDSIPAETIALLKAVFKAGFVSGVDYGFGSEMDAVPPLR